MFVYHVTMFWSILYKIFNGFLTTDSSFIEYHVISFHCSNTILKWKEFTRIIQQNYSLELFTRIFKFCFNSDSEDEPLQRGDSCGVIVSNHFFITHLPLPVSYMETYIQDFQKILKYLLQNFLKIFNTCFLCTVCIHK